MFACMERANIVAQSLLLLLLSSSNPPANQLSLTRFVTIRTHVGSPMRHPTPTFKFLFLSSNINSKRIQDPRRLRFVNSCVPLKFMAAKLEESKIKDTDEDKKKGGKEEEEKKLAKELPPPPEQPEPGDCCGSGCVRCVWDVYYEELEAYNKLYNSDSKDSSVSKSS